MNNFKVFLIKLFTFLGGLYFLLVFLLPEKNGYVNFKDFHEHVSNGFTLVGAMAIGLGLINLVMVHGGKLAYKKSGWLFSGILILGLVVMLGVQGCDWYNKEKNAAQVSKLLMLRDFSKQIIKDDEAKNYQVMPRVERERLLVAGVQEQANLISARDFKNDDLDAAVKSISDLLLSPALSNQSHQSLEDQLTLTSGLYRAQIDKEYSNNVTSHFAGFLNQGLFVSLGSAMFSLLGFYIAAAAYRAFRVRSVEATLMMVAALIVMLGQIPFGIWISPHLPQMRMWLLQVPSAGAARAIEVGAGIAGLILAVRMWLSLESDSFKR